MMTARLEDTLHPDCGRAENILAELPEKDVCIQLINGRIRLAVSGGPNSGGAAFLELEDLARLLTDSAQNMGLTWEETRALARETFLKRGPEMHTIPSIIERMRGQEPQE